MADPIHSTARSWLHSARRVCVLTGAGISAESGIPTFRGVGGLWKNYRAEDLATPEAFHRDPALVWEWYNWRRSLIAAAEPNAGHRALAAFSAVVVTQVVTQNVDGLHRLAGSGKVIEIHGSIWRLRCTRCAHEEENRQVPLGIPPPRCACGALLRPGVVWFGEGLDPKTWEAAECAAGQADVLLVVGTSAVP